MDNKITSALNVGDTVVIRELQNEEEYQNLQEKYFQLNANVKQLLSEPCQVVEIEGPKIKVKTKSDDLLEVNINLLKIIRHVLFKEGETVQVIQGESQFREYQKDHGGWHNIMSMFLGKQVLVVKVISVSIRKIQFLSMEFNVNVACLVKMDKFVANCEVRVIDCEERVKQLQIGHGEWSDILKDCLGKSGFVLFLFENDDVMVSFGLVLWRFNPACLETEFDIVQRKEMEIFINAIENSDKASIIKMANPRTINKPCPHSQMSPLMVAANSHKDPTMLRLLISNGADVNAHYENGNTLLHFLVTNFHGLNEHLDAILEHQVDVNATNDSRMTALMMVCKSGHEYPFAKLIDHPDIDIHVQDDKGNSALHHAITSSADSLISSLIGRGSSLTMENQSSFSPFHLLVIRQNTRILDTVVPPNGHKSILDSQKSNDKFTGLHLCAFHGHLDTMRFLLDRGADPHATNSDGETALHTAVLRSFDCVELLCSVVAGGVNAQDNNGNTPLHKLVKRVPDKQLESVAAIAECLLRFGADVNLRNKQGLTAFECCDHARVKQILLHHADLSDLQEEPAGQSASDLQELQNKISNINEEELCQICLDKRKGLVFNCGHSCCQECGPRLQTCHICRCVITNRIIVQIN